MIHRQAGSPRPNGKRSEEIVTDWSGLLEGLILTAREGAKEVERRSCREANQGIQIVELLQQEAADREASAALFVKQFEKTRG